MDNLNGAAIKARLAQYGHHHCPECYALGYDLSESEFRGLSLGHPAVKAAIRSYQTWFSPDLDRLTMRATELGGYRRQSIADGEVGLATAEVLEYPRCGMPDYMPATTGEANWPDSCRREITTSYRMQLPGLSDSQLADIWQEADQNWADVIDVDFVFLPNEYPNTRIFSFLANLPGSVLADQYLATGNCGFRSQGRVDNRQWSDVLAVTTLTHEHGHALGAEHVQNNQATMYPSITDASMSRRGRPHAADLAEMYRIGYKKRTTPPDDEKWASGRHRVVPYGDDTGSTVLGYVTVQSEGKLAEHSGKLQILDECDVDGEHFEFSRATRM